MADPINYTIKHHDNGPATLKAEDGETALAIIYGDHGSFELVVQEFIRTRRTYTLKRAIVRHKPTARHFACPYSTHEMEGVEFSPGEGRDDAPTWKEVFPTQVTTTVYKATK